MPASTNRSLKQSFIDRYAVYLICVLFFFIGICSLNQMFLYTPDSARYLIWSNSLADLDGFRDATTPEPTRYVVHAPLYPVFLAPIAWLLPYSVIGAKVVTLLFGCLTIFLLYLWLKRVVGERYALLGTIILALNPLTTIYSTQILSDIPFASCFILFFMLGNKLIEREENDWKLEAMFIATVVAALFLREIGLAAMLGAAAFCFWSKQYRRVLLVLAVPLLFYLFWFIRNEMIIAGIENPTLRNTQYFFSHLYTPLHTSFLSELGERLLNNINVYSVLAGKLLFMPDYILQFFPSIASTDSLVKLIQGTFPVMQIVFITVTIGLSVVGFRRQWKHYKEFMLIVFVLVFYLVIIIVYPVNDVRFLFPLALIMIYLSVIGFKYIREWLQKHLSPAAVRTASIGFFFILLLPDIVWLQSFVRNSRQYAQSTADRFMDVTGERLEADSFSKPLHLTAKWIVENSDSSAVVISRCKELALWLEGRKVVEGISQMDPDQFDYLLRDYGVTYIVSVFSRFNISEFENQLVNSRRFWFKPVYHIGKTEVLEVKKRSGLETESIESDFCYSPADSMRLTFRKGLRMLEQDPQNVAKELSHAELPAGNPAPFVYNIAAAKEFSGDLDSAAALYKSLQTLPQAGAILQRAWWHIEIISRVKAAEASTSSGERARRFHTIALNYWQLGFRHQAIKMLYRSLEADPDFAPSLVTLAIFSIRQGDAPTASRSLEKVLTSEPSNNLAAGLASILQYGDSLKINTSSDRQAKLRLKIAELYISIGLREYAIDDLLAVLDNQPRNVRAISLLAKIYEAKSRYAPAIRMYERLVMIDPSDSDAEAKLRELRKRFN